MLAHPAVASARLGAAEHTRALKAMSLEAVPRQSRGIENPEHLPQSLLDVFTLFEVFVAYDFLFVHDKMITLNSEVPFLFSFRSFRLNASPLHRFVDHDKVG